MREYKTVAMPQRVTARRRGRSRAETIAEAVSEVINTQARRGWSYVGADTFTAQERSGLFGRWEERAYSVLVFERDAAAGERDMWDEEEDDAQTSRGSQRRGWSSMMKSGRRDNAEPSFEPRVAEDDLDPYGDYPAPRGGRDAATLRARRTIGADGD